jgi:hypothetical protein
MNFINIIIVELKQQYLIKKYIKDLENIVSNLNYKINKIHNLNPIFKLNNINLKVNKIKNLLNINKIMPFNLLSLLHKSRNIFYYIHNNCNN